MADDVPPASDGMTDLERALKFVERQGETRPIGNIATEAVTRWTSIPEQKDVILNLSRGDVDHLYFCLRAMNDSIVGFQLSMVAWTNGQHDVAGAYYQGCIAANSNASNRLANFMEAVMRRAEPVDDK